MVFDLIFLLLLQAVIQAQATGSVLGTVTDPTKALVAGATFTLVNDVPSQEFTAESNGQGFFRIPDIAMKLIADAERASGETDLARGVKFL